MGDAAMAMADVRRRMKNIRAQLKRCREKDSEAIRQALSSEVLMVYVFSGNDLDAAAEFVRLQKPALSESLDKCRGAVEHIYAQTPVDELAELTNDDCLARYSCKKMVSSCRFIAELRLYQWLVAQNCEHGGCPFKITDGPLLFILSPMLRHGRCAGVRGGHCWALSGCSGSGSNGFGQCGMQSWESWKSCTLPRSMWFRRRRPVS